MRTLQNTRPLSATAIVAASLVAWGASPLSAQEGAAPAAAPPAAAVPAAKAEKGAAIEKKAPPPKSLASWRGQIIAHLNGAKREVAAADGIATVAFRIDRRGKVMSAQVLTSSGNKALDAEAVALTQRASPVPAPPADIAGETLYLKVPIRFKR
jgi:protein TonB